MKELDYHIGNDRLYGRLHIPGCFDGKGDFSGLAKRPAVIFCHGFGANLDSVDDYCSAISDSGYYSYDFDFRGGSASSRSDGSTLDMSVLTEKEDLETVLCGLSQEDFIDDERLFIAGESQGGLVAALAGAEHPELAAGLILACPAFVIPDDAKKRYPDRSRIPEQTDWGFIIVGKRYYEDTYDLDPYEVIGNFSKDVIMIHGSRDRTVPISYSEKALKTYPHSELKIIKGSGHGFKGEARKKTVDWILAFLKDHCK